MKTSDSRTARILRLHAVAIPGTAFFCAIGFLADCMNFNAILAETFLASDRFSANERQLGVLGAVSALGYTVPSLAMGLLSEVVGRRPMLVTAMAGLLVSFALVPGVETLGGLYALALLRAVSTALLWPPLMAWMSEVTAGAALARVLGFYNISWSMGILVGYGLAGWTAESARFGIETPFRLSLVLAAFITAFLLLVVPRPIQPKRTAPLSGKQLREENQFPSLSAGAARLWILRGLGLMGLGCAVQGAVLYLTLKLVGPEVGKDEQGMLHVARMVGQVIGFFGFAATASWHFRLWPVPVSLGCFGAGLVIAGIAGPDAASPSGYAALAFGYGVIGLGFGMAFMLCSYYTLGLVRRKGLGSGVMETLVGGGGLLGPLAAGEIAVRTSPQTALFASVLPLACAAALALPWERLGVFRRMGNGPARE